MKEGRHSQFRKNEQVILWNPCYGWPKYTILTVVDGNKAKDGCYKILVSDPVGKTKFVPTKFLRHYR